MGNDSKMESRIENTVLITGATGFVGRFLCKRLLAEGLRVRGTLLASENPSALIDKVEPVTVEPLGPDTPWHHALSDIHTIIHPVVGNFGF